MITPFIDPGKFLNKDFIFAIIGASNDRDKPGFALFGRFLRAGLRAIPVKVEEGMVLNIQGEPCFPGLLSVRPFPQAVVMVGIQPFKTLEFLRQMRDMGLYRVWLEQGTFDEEVLSFCQSENFEVYRDLKLEEFLLKMAK